MARRRKMKDRTIILVCFIASIVCTSAVVVYLRLPRTAPQERTNLPVSDDPAGSESRPEPTVISITGNVIVPKAKRLGINLGGRSPYGASQIIKNLIPNPGFESAVYGSVLHADAKATGTRVPQAFWVTEWNHEQYGIGQPEGFWDGADYEIVYGPAKGRRGTVKRFTLENNQNVFYLDQPGPAPQEYDVLLVRKELKGIFVGTRMSENTVDTASIRPESPGKQSLHLSASGSPTWNVYLDSEWRDGDVTAGKLLVIEGPWRFAFWARGGESGGQLRARFYREGETEFVNEVLTLSPEWQLYEFAFDAAPGVDRNDGYREGDYHPLLVASVTLEGATAEAWLDDATLERTDQSNPTVFTEALVERLRELRPGVIRDWSTQLGETLENQLAEPWARKTAGFSPKQRAGGDFSYSLHEFLELCEALGAEPWYVIPPSFSPEDMRGLTEYLAAPADGAHPFADRRSALGHPAPWTDAFPQIHLEYGNEMWGAASGSDPFFGASALGGVRLGEIASDRFALLKAHPAFRAENFDLIIGGQYYFPGRQEEIQSNSTEHDTVALAPYFGGLDTHDTPANMYYPLFARPFEDAAKGKLRESAGLIQHAGRNTGMAIYEINFHTTGGDIPNDVRNDFVTGAGGTLALPLHMLVYQRDFGIRAQCAFTALQYSFDMGSKNYVRLWGMLRDIAATGRKRPTWLGVELANQIIQGDMIETLQSGPNPSWYQEALNGLEHDVDVTYIQSFAFREGDAFSAILFNLSLEFAMDVSIETPAPPSHEATMLRLSPASIGDDNEDRERLTIETRTLDDFRFPYPLALPPHSVTALRWTTANKGP
ncbi:MAG: hypothetical protein IT364_13575 [Candidatus Hydrogenedentes bacterium]|nr:hypothetical protein [Candidatus Hydrogenedentota bacterium]